MKSSNTPSDTPNSSIYTSRYPWRSNVQYSSTVATTKNNEDGATSSDTCTRYPQRSNIQYQHHDSKKRSSTTSNREVSTEKYVDAITNNVTHTGNPLCKGKVTLQKCTKVPEQETLQNCHKRK
jgi:hypothetical protein